MTGTTPLEKKRLKGATLLEVLRLIREEEPHKPSTRLSTTEELPAIAANRGLEPKELSGVVRGDLDWIVVKALDKDRNRRYDAAGAFAADVQRYLRDEPVLAGPPSARYRLRKFLRRNRRAVLAAAVFLALALAGLTISAALIWQANRAKNDALVKTREALGEARDKKEAADRAAEEARQAANEAEATVRFLINDMLEHNTPA